MKRDYDKNSALANFSCDYARKITKSDFCILNQGMFRGIWYPGNISYYKFYGMFSLTNDLINFEVKGSILKRIMMTLNCGKKAFYATSGLSSYVKLNPKKCLVKITKSNKEEIIDDKTYTVASVDFLIKGGDDFKDVLKYFKPVVKREFGEFREIMINYLIKNNVIIKGKDILHEEQPSIIQVE